MMHEHMNSIVREELIIWYRDYLQHQASDEVRARAHWISSATRNNEPFLKPDSSLKKALDWLTNFDIYEEVENKTPIPLEIAKKLLKELEEENNAQTPQL